MAPSTSERTPLLPASSLNPLAASFSFSPPIPSTSTFSPVPLAVVRSTPPPAPETDASLPAEEEDARRAHTLSPHTRTHSTTASDFSFGSIIPTRRAFRRAHLWVQFPVSFIVCAGLAGALVVSGREVRWWELGLGMSGWLASESLKDVIFDLLTFESVSRDGVVVRGTGLGLPTIVHAVLQEFLRLGAISLTVTLLPDPTPSHFAPIPRPPSHRPRRPLPPLDTLFFSALWLALGWALIEIAFGSRDFWRRMKLYDDVLEEEEYDQEADLGSFESEDEEEEEETGRGGYGSATLTARGGQQGYEAGTDKGLPFLSNSAFDRVVADPAARQEAEEVVDARIRAVEREEVEGQLGVPLYEIPVAVVIVWRLDSYVPSPFREAALTLCAHRILLALDLTLLLSLPFRTTSPSLVPFPLWPTFFAATAIHVLLSLLWVLSIRWVGIPSVSYATLVLLIGALFAVLAAWGALE